MRRSQVLAVAVAMLLAGLIGWYVLISLQINAERKAVQKALALRASITFDYQFEGGEPDNAKRVPGARPGLFQGQGHVVALMTEGPKWRDSDLSLLRHFSRLRELNLNGNTGLS